MNNRSGASGVNLGITTVAVIFAVICLTIFAVLSLSTASQEKKLAEKYAASVTAYWQADGECTELADAFGALLKTGAGFNELSAFAAANGADIYEEDGEIYVSYSRQIDGTNSLFVTLKLSDGVHVTQWQQVYTGLWEADISLDVWQGT
ncbi:MAG: hypothetical protein ACI3VB_03015 [Oscillospiraceae bacterium]